MKNSPSVTDVEFASHNKSQNLKLIDCTEVICCYGQCIHFFHAASSYQCQLCAEYNMENGECITT